ncbi:MAG TPA: class I SAM-dependent methyltransferase [Candidatus Saccharimonadales bacterium]|nr:class I SAM-dependent methyltransferase [Candidatus Saccharimonadales bacterium]
MKVVEIGCGPEAGPRFDGADEHYIVDTDEVALGSAYFRDIRLTPMIASATDLDFEDGSVDTVLARNVFGDNALTISNPQKEELAVDLLALDREGRHWEIISELTHLESKAFYLKLDIMREAARILVGGGQLVAVERLSPKVAGRFFDFAAEFSRLDGRLDLDTVFDIEQGLPLEDVTPPNYAETHASPKTKTWVATKK